jgi:hypothetical protein
MSNKYACSHAPYKVHSSTLRRLMLDDPQPQKIPLVFYRTGAGSEPVRDWLKGLPETERHAIRRSWSNEQETYGFEHR